MSDINQLKIIFPKINDSKQNEEYSFEKGKPIVILGANGAGKTRFSVKIEELNDSTCLNGTIKNSITIHRISAQKSLSIDKQIIVNDIQSSKELLYIGSTGPHQMKHHTRFASNPSTHLLNDFSYLLSLVFSKSNDEMAKDRRIQNDAIDGSGRVPAPTETTAEKIENIWHQLLPSRRIDFDGFRTTTHFGETSYHSQEMSDGERVLLYMIAQAILLPSNTLFIIDEPELHIHKSIVKKLWDTLEQARPDCIFMYITHDLDFAVSRNTESTFWIKAFNGIDWDYELLTINSEEQTLPTELVYELLGAKQKFLFVEGTKDSYDYKVRYPQQSWGFERQ